MIMESTGYSLLGEALEEGLKRIVRKEVALIVEEQGHPSGLPLVMTVSRAAKELDCSKDTVRRLVERKELAASGASSELRIRRDSLLEYMDVQTRLRLDRVSRPGKGGRHE